MASLGEAIALGANLGSHEAMLNSALARRDAREAAAAEAKRKAQEKDDEELKKVVNEADIYLNPEKWSKPYIPAATKSIVDFKNDIINYKSQYPNTWQTYAYKRFDDLKGQLSNLSDNSNKFKDFEKESKTNKFYVPDNFLETVNKTDFSKGMYKDAGGNWVSPAWEQIGGSVDPRYGVMLDPTGSFNVNPVVKTDTDKSIEAWTNNPQNMTDKGISMSPTNISGVMQAKKTSIADPAKASTFISALSSDPMRVREFILNNKDAIDKDIKSDPSLRDPEKYKDHVQSMMQADLMNRVSSPKIELSHFNLPKEEKKDNSIENVSVGAARPIRVQSMYVNKSGEPTGHYTDDTGATFYESGGKYYKVNEGESKQYTPKNPVFVQSGESKLITSQSSATFSAKQLSVSPPFSIDMNSGKSMLYNGNVTYNISAIDKLPYVRDEKGGYILVDDKSRANIEAKGQKVFLGWFATGEEAAGTTSGEKVRLPVAVPLTKEIMGDLKNKKVDISGINENELWENKLLGAGEGGGGDNSKMKDINNIPTITNDKDFEKLPSGSIFIDGNGNKHTKK